MPHSFHHIYGPAQCLFPRDCNTIAWLLCWAELSGKVPWHPESNSSGKKHTFKKFRHAPKSYFHDNKKTFPNIKTHGHLHCRNFHTQKLKNLEGPKVHFFFQDICCYMLWLIKMLFFFSGYFKYTTCRFSDFGCSSQSLQVAQVPLDLK